MTTCVPSRPDHGVLLVGYDAAVSPPYWNIKNSWGPTWGESGFIRIEKGTDQCLVSHYPTSSIAKNGPAPPPPAPTVGPSPTVGPNPTAAPAPAANGTFTEKQCGDHYKCKVCTSHTLPQGTCVAVTGGGSAMAQCTGTALVQTVYQASGNCTGAAQQQSIPTGQCLKDSMGTYFEVVCNGEDAVADFITAGSQLRAL